MPFEYYWIQAGESDEPGIDGGIGEVKDVPFSDGKPLCVVTIPVVNLDESISKVTESGGSIMEPKWPFLALAGMRPVRNLVG